jgi:hypothetical protein
MISSYRSVIGLSASLALTAAPAVAQVIRGQVLDADRGQPIPAARLLLITEAGATLDTTMSDGQGRFRLEAPAPGSYLVYFATEGWAGVPSDQLRLKRGVTTDFVFRVPLLTHAEVNRIAEIITADGRLQRPLPELCGEPVRAWEAGLLVGVVRERGSDRPVAGARIAVAGADSSGRAASGRLRADAESRERQAGGDGGTRATVSSAKGVYVLCNVLAGPAVKLVITSPQGFTETTQVEVRAGTVGWYDLPVRTRR